MNLWEKGQTRAENKEKKHRGNPREHPAVPLPVTALSELPAPSQAFAYIPASPAGREKENLLLGGGRNETAKDMPPNATNGPGEAINETRLVVGVGARGPVGGREDQGGGGAFIFPSWEQASQEWAFRSESSPEPSAMYEQTKKSHYFF